LGLENGKIIIAPEIKGFIDYSNYDNLVFYKSNEVSMLKNALQQAVTIFNEH
jgi:hypothetical protein